MAERHRERRPRRRREEFSDESEAARDQRDQDFISDVESRLQSFISESEEQSLAFEPMNSYNRRLVHTIAKTYLLDTESHGEDRDRHVVVIKTSDTRIPKDAANATAKATAAMRQEREVGERDAPRERGGRDRGERPERSERSDRGGRERGPRSGGRTHDYGSQQFPCKPGSHIALKADGSVELYRESEASYIVADKVVNGSYFRVRKGQIVEPGEEGY